MANKMDLDKKQDMIMDAIGDLDWSDDKIPEVMEGFFNNPGEAVERCSGQMTEDHINSLFDTLDLEDKI